MTIAKSGHRIESLEDWERYAGPKKPTQWKDGRSAKEIARAWLSAQGSLPAEVTAAIASNPSFGLISCWEAEPEALQPFDKFRGEPRNCDLAIYANDQYGPFLIAVEAKADEPFGDTVGKVLAAAVKTLAQNPCSNGVARVEQLLIALIGHGLHKEPSLGSLRYQLLTATAGALSAAKRAKIKRAVVFVHEFVTDVTTDEKHAINAADLSNFVSRLSNGSMQAVESGCVYGPFVVPPGAPLVPCGVELFIGKATRSLRQNRA